MSLFFFFDDFKIVKRIQLHCNQWHYVNYRWKFFFHPKPITLIDLGQQDQQPGRLYLPQHSPCSHYTHLERFHLFSCTFLHKEIVTLLFFTCFFHLTVKLSRLCHSSLLLFSRQVMSNSLMILVCQGPLSSTISQSLLTFICNESVMLSNYLILCCPLSFCHQPFHH